MTGYELLCRELGSGVQATLAASGDPEARRVLDLPMTCMLDTVYHFELYALTDAGRSEAVTAVYDPAVAPFFNTVTAYSPEGKGAARDCTIVVEFSKPVFESKGAMPLEFRPELSGTFTWSQDRRSVAFKPDEPMGKDERHSVTAPDAVSPLNGFPFGWSFTTGDAPRPRSLTARPPTPGLWLVGVPVVPEGDARADAVLGTSQVCRWDAAAQEYWSFAKGAFDVKAGEGYWYVASSSTPPISAMGRTVSGSLPLQLRQGWNLLANPYETALPWSQVQTGTQAAPLGWVQEAGGEGYAIVSSIPALGGRSEVPAWCGFWLEAREACTVTLSEGTEPPVKVEPAPSDAAPPSAPQVRRAVRVAAEAGSVADRDNFIGVTTAGTGLRAQGPPRMPQSYVDLYALGADSKRYAVDLAAAGGATAWDLAVETNLAKTEVRVSLPDLSPVSCDLAVVLKDLDAGRRVNLRTQRAYCFTSGEHGGVRHLRLEIKPREQGPALVTSALVQPGAAGVRVVYTLSAEAEVELRVTNIAGRMVAGIPLGTQEAGSHVAVWPCRSATGGRVPRGQYLIQVRCAGQDGTQMTRVVPTQVR